MVKYYRLLNWLYTKSARLIELNPNVNAVYAALDDDDQNAYEMAMVGVRQDFSEFAPIVHKLERMGNERWGDICY